MALNKPLLCPFCGGEAFSITELPGGRRWVQCGDCESKGRWDHDEANAVAAWNRRSGDTVLAWIATQPREVLAKIEDAIQARRNALDICEHGIPDGEYCQPCSAEYRRARIAAGFEEEGTDDWLWDYEQRPAREGESDL